MRAYSDSDAENFHDAGVNGHNFRHPLNFRHRYSIYLMEDLVTDCLGRCLFKISTLHNGSQLLHYASCFIFSEVLLSLNVVEVLNADG